MRAAQRGLANVVAGFKGDVPRTFGKQWLVCRKPIGMLPLPLGLTECRMPSLAYDSAVSTDNDTPHERVGRHRELAAFRQFHGGAHELHIGGRKFHAGLIRTALPRPGVLRSMAMVMGPTPPGTG